MTDRNIPLSHTIRNFIPTTPQAKPKQAKFLTNNPHIYPLHNLPDGDLLVIDQGYPDPQQFVPYILTIEGELQQVLHHYNTYHRMIIPTPSRIMPPKGARP